MRDIAARHTNTGGANAGFWDAAACYTIAMMGDLAGSTVPDPTPASGREGVSVAVTAPARLHLGFVDLSGDLGRRFGGLGLTLSDVCTRLSVSRAASWSGSGPCSERAVMHAQVIMRALGLAGALSIDVREAIPEHVGLGSGTQLALAVCGSLVRLFDLDSNLRALAQITGRGVRSGIGLGAFEYGGFIVDGGRNVSRALPPVICQAPFPESWRVLLILDRRRQGLNGSEEASAFERLPTMETGVSGWLCRLLLMQVLPALAERDFKRFCEGLSGIQDRVGDFFAPLQGGRYSSPGVAEVLGWLKEQGLPGVGQSSWGPTGFAMIENAAQAERILRLVRDRWAGPLEFILCGGRNSGAEIVVQKLAA